MLPGSLVLATKHSLIIVHPAVVLDIPDPSAERLKCSWHLGMMKRIIETPSLKGKCDPRFCSKKYSICKNTLTGDGLYVRGCLLARLTQMRMRVRGVFDSLHAYEQPRARPSRGAHDVLLPSVCAVITSMKHRLLLGDPTPTPRKKTILTVLRFRANDPPSSTSKRAAPSRKNLTNDLPYCGTCLLIVLCTSYPQLVVLSPLIPLRNAAKVVLVISNRREWDSLSFRKEVACSS